ncbi:MAG: DUF1294 domain-containing protein [Clostridiales bacterium]|nr:DUF1294 domain-containing protein [Clostridiales bacterium]
MKPFLYYLLIVSVLSFLITVHDKLAAKRRTRRVPENVLLLFSALGGSAAMYITMLIIRHKTRHPKFMIGIPVIFVMQVCLILFVLWKFKFL